MPETVYNWGGERIRLDPDTGERVKVATQNLVTGKGLVPSRIPVYVAPQKHSNMSRGFLDYDPLGRA